MVLWSSFITGVNTENRVLALGNREMWNLSLDIKETFFTSFKSPVIIDLPGFSYDVQQHASERELLRKYFEAKDSSDKERIRNDYNGLALKHHQTIKAAFEKALMEDHDFILAYFSLADVLGHLNFGDSGMMKIVYDDFNAIAASVRGQLIVLSDHGMVNVGMFGDHSNYGFWSTAYRDLGNPKITSFGKIIADLMLENASTAI
jgi:hypothetical protein